MVVDPGTAILIATAVQAAAKGAGDFMSNTAEKKRQKRRSKELERETNAELANESKNRSAEMEVHRLAGRQKLGKRKSASHHETSDLIRGALNI